jgi:hypothetical protein
MKRGYADATADATTTASIHNQPFSDVKRNPKKSLKMVNKLLKNALTPDSILQAFRKVYGPNVKATVKIEDDSQTVAPTSVANVILWTLEGPMKRNTPSSWFQLSNRPLVQTISIVMIPSLNPCILSTSLSTHLPFLSKIMYKTLRVGRTGRTTGCTGSILRCTSKNNGKQKRNHG